MVWLEHTEAVCVCEKLQEERSKWGCQTTRSLRVRQAWDQIPAQPPISSVIVSKYLCNIHKSLSVNV